MKSRSLQHEDGHWVNPNARYQENIKDLATAYSVIAIKNSLSGVNLEQPKAGILDK